MPDFNLSTNMNLPIPVTGVCPGPAWANDVNAALTLLDAHDHSTGKGVQITPAGININTDLVFNSNNATFLRSVRFVPQLTAFTSPTDIGCLYEIGADLYYRDGNQNNVRITQSGGVAGTPGSITNLTAPASATYVGGNQTFVFQSAANTAANLDAGFLILRNSTALSNGLTLLAPTLSSNYSLTLPQLPGSTNIVTLDASGNFGAALNVDNSTLQIAANTISVKNAGITTAKIVDGNVTQAKLAPRPFTQPATTGSPAAAGGIGASNSSGGYNTSSTTPVDVTNLAASIICTGRPIMLMIVSDGSGNDAEFVHTVAGTGVEGTIFFTLGNNTLINSYAMVSTASTTIGYPGAISCVFVAPVGPFPIRIDFKVRAKVGINTNNLAIHNCVLLVYEL